eukprot:5093442-Pleurochrysis_carterae.AAC.2
MGAAGTLEVAAVQLSKPLVAMATVNWTQTTLEQQTEGDAAAKEAPMQEPIQAVGVEETAPTAESEAAMKPTMEEKVALKEARARAGAETATGAAAALEAAFEPTLVVEVEETAPTAESEVAMKPLMEEKVALKEAGARAGAETATGAVKVQVPVAEVPARKEVKALTIFSEAASGSAAAAQDRRYWV